MKGYFSSLIQRAGIDVGVNSGSGFHLPATPLPSPEGSGETTPLHLEEIKVVETRHGEVAGKVSEAGMHALPMEKRAADQAAPEKPRPEFPATNVGHKTQEPRMIQTMGRESSKTETDIEKEDPRREDPFPEREVIVEHILREEDALQPHDARSGATDKPVTFREIREWMAVTPAPEATRQDKPPERISSPAKSGRLIEESKIEAIHSPPESQGQRIAPEIQRNEISIGSIHLVIEEPPGNFSSQSSLPKTVERPPARKSDSSRLSRHYLRIR